MTCPDGDADLHPSKPSSTSPDVVEGDRGPDTSGRQGYQLTLHDGPAGPAFSKIIASSWPTNRKGDRKSFFWAWRDALRHND